MEIVGLPLKTFLLITLVPLAIVVVLVVWGMLYRPSE